MRPYETIEDLEAMLKETQEVLRDACHLRWKIRQQLGDASIPELEAKHFEAFESMCKEKIEEIQFCIQLEVLLSEENS